MSPRGDQLPMPLERPAGASSLSRVAVGTARQRGLEVDPSGLTAEDRAHIGQIGFSLACLNTALRNAADAGIDVSVTVHHQDLPDNGRKLATLRARARRTAFDLGV